MTNEQAKALILKAAEKARSEGNLDQAARIEIAAEYFTNPEFRSVLEQHVWAINQKVAA